jgi:predicted nucleic acid-binding protein
VILVDSSAWVEYDRATGTEVDLRLHQLIELGGPLAVTEPVLMEVLAGARDESAASTLRALLLRCRLLRFDPVVDFEAAAKIYRTCRRAGVTPRGMVDCMIANVSLRHAASVLTTDRDFRAMAAVIGLDVEPLTP